MRPTHPSAVARRPRRLVAVGVVLAAALTSCGSGGSGSGGSGSAADVPVVATTSVLADVATQVTCGRIRVPSVIPRGADAHEYEPGMRDADRLGGASLVVANGLGLEERLADSLDQARAGGAGVLEVAPRLDPRTVDGEPDPHVWMDPVRMARAAEVVGGRLQRVPGLGVSRRTVADCTRRYAAELRELADDMAATLAAVPPERRKLVTGHEALGYFAERFDFQVVGSVIPSTSSLGEANPRDLDELAATVRREGVPAVFGETTQPARVARSLADRVGVPVRVVPLLTESLGRPGTAGGTYVGMLGVDARRVAEALSAPAG